MCIACRTRESQQELIRLQMHDKHVIPYRGSGRSFYICHQCANDSRKMRNISKRLGTEQDSLLNTLKEFVTNGEN